MAWDTIAHIIPSVLCLALMPITIFVNKKLYCHIKDEKHREKGRIIQSIIQTYALVNCIAFPCVVGILILGKIVIDIIQPEVAAYVVPSIFLIYILYIDYVTFHSLIVAICRYTFVILDNQAEAIGIERLKSIFIGSTVGVPIFSALLYTIIYPLDDILIQWLYGQDSSSDTANLSDFLNNMNSSSTHNSAVYLLYNEYCPESIKLGMKVLEFVIFITVYSNVPEGFMYTHITIYSKRY